MTLILCVMFIFSAGIYQEKIDCRNICADQKAGAIQREACRPKPKPCRKRRKVPVAQFIRDNMPQDACVEVVYPHDQLGLFLDICNLASCDDCDGSNLHDSATLSIPLYCCIESTCTYLDHGWINRLTLWVLLVKR